MIKQIFKQLTIHNKIIFRPSYSIIASLFKKKNEAEAQSKAGPTADK
jgi:hypothetical protein